MLNHITIMGRFTRDPEMRRTGNGNAVTSFTLAVDRDFTPKDGGDRETDFIDCVAWRQAGEFVAKHFTKGRMAVVSGRLEIRNWNDKDGNKRRSAEVIVENIYFADSKKDDNKQASAPQAPDGNQNPAGSAYGASNQYGAPAGGSYGAPANGGYNPPANNGYSAPAGGNYGGYSAPAGGFGGFAPLGDDDAKLPF